jgi:2-polyprenyl-6-methoxyphenol hydroxylase-like FAD-dependent oxidoreductase
VPPTVRGRRVTIIGGGVMGLMTAYAAPQAGAVTVLERSLAQLALRQGTGYDLRRFAPARFAGGRGPAS